MQAAKRDNREVERVSFTGIGFRRWSGAILALAVFLLIWAGLSSEWNTEAKISLAITGAAIVLWVTEAVPLGKTSFLIILIIGVTKIVPLDVALSGFSSGAIFLIIAGMMIARAVNDTPLAQRITYFILLKLGSRTSKLLAGIIFISQIQALFIPATAVRASLLLPVVISLLHSFDYRAHPNIRKQLMLGIAYGGNISGTAILPAAIGNVLTVEILNMYLGTSLSYFQWFSAAFPIWLLLIPAIWIIIMRTCPAEAQQIPGIKETISREMERIGKLSSPEKRCIMILAVTVLLWVTESFHQMHPAVPAVLAAVLLSLPKIGVTSWENMTKINLDTVFLLGVTLSLGRVLNETGAVEYLGQFLQAKWIISSFQHSLLAVVLVVAITQIYHLGVSNVSTAVVTLLPLLIGLATQIGVDPVVICFTSAITSLYGFILVVETMPNVIVQGSGYLNQREFVVPGICATLVSGSVTILVAATWWRWIGFLQ